MLCSDERWLSVTDAFYSAAIDGKGWNTALEGLAAASGSRAGELIGLGSAHTVPFNWVTDLGPDWVEAFLAIGGGDPRINPYVRVGSQARELEVLSSGQFISAEERRNGFFMNEHAVPWGLEYCCLTPLVKQAGMLVGLAVLRSGRQGEISEHQRAVFASIAPHVRAAVRMQMALEHQGAAIMANALESLSLAVFICDQLGTVRSMTPAAEKIVSQGTGLRLRQARLHANDPAETRALTDAIAVAAAGMRRPGNPLFGTVPLRSGPSPLVLEVVPVPPRECNFGFEPRVLVVVRGTQPDTTRLRGLLQLLHGLTDAESDVAVHLTNGLAPEAVAAARHTSVGTVRAQIRSLYAKLGVSRQSELVSRLNQLKN